MGEGGGVEDTIIQNVIIFFLPRKYNCIEKNGTLIGVLWNCL